MAIDRYLTKGRRLLRHQLERKAATVPTAHLPPCDSVGRTRSKRRVGHRVHEASQRMSRLVLGGAVQPVRNLRCRCRLSLDAQVEGAE